MNIFLLTISLLLLILTLPGTVELLMLTLASLLPSRSYQDGAEEIKLAVVIPAHNEETGLPQTLNSLLDCDQPLTNNDLIVIADNCSDGTAEVAKLFSVRLIERFNDEQRGKGYALNYAFTQLIKEDYDGFIVVDADTVVDNNFINAYRSFFAAGESAGQAVYRVNNASENLRTRLMNIAFLAFNLLRPKGRDNLGLSCGILGNGFALSKETLEAIPYDSFSVVEDLEHHLRLIRAGYKVRYLRDTTVWSDMPASSQEAQSQRERWEGGRFRMMRELIPQLVRDIFLRGKLAMVEPLLELLLLPLGFHVVLVLILLIFGSGLFQLYALLSLAVVALHVTTAMVLGKAGWDDWQALLAAPFYVLWKLANLGGIIKTANKDADWKRTSR